MRNILNVLSVGFICAVAGSSHAGVLSYWNFNEPFGTDGNGVNDLVGSNHGLLVVPSGQNAPEQPSSGAGTSGTDYGQALDLAGTTAYANLGTNVPDFDFGQDDFSITGWFKLPTNTTDTHVPVFTNEVAAQGGMGVMVLRNGHSDGGKFHFTVKGPGSGPTYNKGISSDETVDDDNWHWFAGVVDDKTMYLYLDGVLQDSTAYGADTTATPPAGKVAGIGSYDVVSGYDGVWPGQMDDLAIFDSALTGTLDASDTLIGGELYTLWQQGTAAFGGFAPDYTVPEPSSALLCLMAFFGLVILRRRR